MQPVGLEHNISMQGTNNKSKRPQSENSKFKLTERTIEGRYLIVQHNPNKTLNMDKMQIKEQPEDSESVAKWGKYLHTEIKRMIFELNKDIKEIDIKMDHALMTHTET